MAAIEFRDVSKIFADGTRAVDSLDLSIEEGEFMVLVGPSGCGKTTALRMVAGLEEISEGTITIGDRVVNDASPKERDIAMVFQNYALYPHMTRRAEPGLRTEAAQAEQGGDRAQGARGGDDARARRVPRAQARHTLRRPAPASRDGAGDRPGAACVPDGRAALESRREAARADARRRSRSCSARSASRRSTSRTTRPKR